MLHCDGILSLKKVNSGLNLSQDEIKCGLAGVRLQYQVEFKLNLHQTNVILICIDQNNIILTVSNQVCLGQ